jgi:cell division septation protein DedD
MILCAATIAAQNTYQYQNVVEIPLDDFPSFMEGYRIQIGAFATEDAARTFANSLRDSLIYGLHLHYDDGLWLVRIGDFPDSVAVLEALDGDLNIARYQSVMVIPSRIKVNILADLPQRIPGFRIQVHVTPEREAALELGRKLDYDYYPEVRAYVIRHDSLYKVLLGDFRSRSETESLLKRLKGITGMNPWIIPALVYENPPPSPLQRPVSDPFDYMD